MEYICFREWPLCSPIFIDIAVHESWTIIRVTNNVTNNQKIRPQRPAKVRLLTESTRSEDWLCRKDFLRAVSRSLGPALLATTCRSLVLTVIATRHAGEDMGASRTRLSLEHKVDHVTAAGCSVSPFSASTTNAKIPYSTDVVPVATRKARGSPPRPDSPNATPNE